MEDVHRAGGVIGILGELDRAGLLHRDAGCVHSDSLGAAIDRWDITRSESETARHRFLAAAVIKLLAKNRCISKDILKQFQSFL